MQSNVYCVPPALVCDGDPVPCTELRGRFWTELCPNLATIVGDVVPPPPPPAPLAIPPPKNDGSPSPRSCTTPTHQSPQYLKVGPMVAHSGVSGVRLELQV